MPFVPASAFNEVFYRQLWVQDGVASARRSRRVRRSHRKARAAENEQPTNRVRVGSPVHPTLRHLASDPELRRV